MKHSITILLMIVAIFMVGCSFESQGHSESLVTQLEHESEHAESVDIDISELLVEYKTVTVDTDLASFHTLTHTDQLEKYPCSTCHEALSDNNLETSTEPHWDIELNHAPAEVMTCTTCHATEDLDTLRTLTDVPIEFEHSYKVCAQCHSSQYEDWIGGAHGKRIEGWAEPRVVENCVGCHNPHEPAWDIRWPAVTGGGIED